MATLVAAIDARKAKQGAQEFKRAVDSMGKEAVESGRQVDQLDRKMDGLGKTGALIKRQFAGLLAGITAVAAVRSAVRVYADYEETMKQVAGVTGAAGEQMEMLSEAARNAGATTRFSASEAGQGLLFLARAGYDVEQAIGALPSTLDLAIVGMLELGEAADIASNVATQFNIAAEDTSRIVDTLVTVANSANTDVRGLAQALTFAGVAAGKLGIDVETTAAAIGVLGDAGIQGGRAGTNLRQIMVQLLQPTGDAAKGIRELGLTLKEVNPLQNDFIEIFERFANVDQSKLAELSPTIFGSRQFSAGLQLVSAVERMKELRDASYDAAGAGERLARFFNDTFKGAVKSLISVTQELVLQLMESGLAGAMILTIRYVTDVLRVFAGYTKELETNRVAVMALVVALRLMAATFSVMIAMRIPAMFAAITKAVGVLAVAVRGAAVKIGLMTGPLGWVALAIGGVVTAIYTFREEIKNLLQTSFEFQNRTVSVWALVQASFEHGVELMKIALATIAWAWEMTWAGFGEPIKAAVSTVWSLLKVGLQEMWELTSTGLDKLLDLVQIFANSVIGVVVSMGETIGIIAGRLLHTLKGVGDVLADPTDADAWKAAWRGIKDGFDITDATKEIKDVWQRNMQEDFLADVRTFVDGVTGTVGSGIDLLVEDVNAALNALAKLDPEFAVILDRLNEQGGLSLTGHLESILARAEEIQGVINGTGPRVSADPPMLEAAIPQVSEDPPNLQNMTQPYIDQWMQDQGMMRAELEKTLDLLRGGATQEQLEEQLDVWRTIQEVKKQINDAGLPADQIDEEGYLDGIREQLRSMQDLERQIDKVREARERDKKEMQEYEQRQRAFGDALTRSFEDAAAAAITSGASIEQVLLNLSEAFVELFLRQVVFQQVTGALGGLFGDVFGAISPAPTGSVPAGANGMFIERYAKGGWFNSPTYLQQADSTPALVGEAGREAIFPVRVGADGQFGVKATLPEGSNGGTTNNNSFNITIQTPDANSFRQSEQQIASQMRRMQRRAGGPV